MDWKDPAWWSLVVATIALLFSIPSVLLSWKSLRWERSSADAATRSAEAAERANLLTERALARDVDDAVSDAVQRQLDAIVSATLSAGTPGESITMSNARSLLRPGPTDVHWQIEKASGSQYILRNTGLDIAEHVGVDPAQLEQLGGFARSMPTDAVIRPGEGVGFLVMSAWGNPAPNQLYLKWNDMQEYVAVPMPG
jgi:hypothetical protein